MTPDHPSAARLRRSILRPYFFPLFSLHGSQGWSDNCLLIKTDHGTKEENYLQMW